MLIFSVFYDKLHLPFGSPFSSVQSRDRSGHCRDMRDDSAEIFFQSFLQEALVSRQRCPFFDVVHPAFPLLTMVLLTLQVPIRMALESGVWHAQTMQVSFSWHQETDPLLNQSENSVLGKTASLGQCTQTACLFHDGEQNSIVISNCVSKSKEDKLGSVQVNTLTSGHPC